MAKKKEYHGMARRVSLEKRMYDILGEVTYGRQPSAIAKVYHRGRLIDIMDNAGCITREFRAKHKDIGTYLKKLGKAIKLAKE